MKLIKKSNGSIILEANNGEIRTLSKYAILEAKGNNEVLVKQGQGQWDSIFLEDLETEIEPASPVEFTGDINSLIEFLAENFFFDISSSPPSTSLTTAKLMKTGQTTSYRTGDDGDLQEGRDVDFFTLAENNPFGTTDRFTDELGTQVYANDIVIDWSTFNGAEVLGWRRTLGGTVSWNTAIDQCLAISIPPFISGWRLPNIQEIFSIMYFEYTGTYPWNYSPMNIGDLVWTSTSITNIPSAAYYTITGGLFGLKSKTQVNKYIACRTFTVTGTTLS